MGKKYDRLSHVERDVIAKGLAQKLSFSEIAKCIGRHVSTVTREVGKGSANRWTYLPSRAQNRARRNAARRRTGKRKLDGCLKLWTVVSSWLRKKWSPEEIAHRLICDYPNDMDMRVSHEAIYQYVYVMPKGTLKKELLECMRRNHKRRHTRRTYLDSSKPMGKMTSIDERPLEVETREEAGHWEGDLMIGKYAQSAMGTLVERKTKKTLLVKLTDKSASEVRMKFAKVLMRLDKEMRKTMTYDQGREMAQHEKLSKATKIKVFFAHKSSPWERGTNENTNGLLRQYFPRGTDFNKVSAREIKRVEDELNGRPRRCLGWATPDEVFPKKVALEC